jgi:hypothetical protein
MKPSLHNLIFLLFTFQAVVSIPGFARTINRDLKSQVADDPNRTLPQGDNYNLAGDLLFFWNVDQGEDDFYHSGYWLNLFGEYRPLERLALNLKVAALNPSNSYGYNGSGLVIPFFSASYSDEFFNFIKVSLLAFDLDRQTLGGGLLISEKEMSGMLWTTQIQNFRLAWVKPGTGVFNYGGDADIIKADWNNDLIGGYGSRFSVPEIGSNWVQDESGTFRDPQGEKASWEYVSFFGIYSQFRHSSGIYYQAEYTKRPSNEAQAHLERIGWAGDGNIFSTKLWAEHRQYDLAFFDGIVGRVDQDYVTIEDREKEVFNTMNIAPAPTNEHMWIGGISGTLFSKSMIRLSTRNECAFWQNRSKTDRPVYAFDQAVEYCPWAGKDSCGRIAYSNIVANASGLPDEVDYGNKPMQKLVRHVRFEARAMF